MAKNKNNNTLDSNLEPTQSKLGNKSELKVKHDSVLFGKKNFGYMALGVGLIFIGYLLMAGGSMPSPEVWDESIIYSTRRTVIAPVFILAGFAMQFMAIFAKKD